MHQQVLPLQNGITKKRHRRDFSILQRFTPATVQRVILDWLQIFWVTGVKKSLPDVHQIITKYVFIQQQFRQTM